VLFHVHDEVVVDAPMDARPEQVVAELTRLPAWADQLPVAAEAEESTHYKK
jgi:DNA polymerase